MNTLALTLLFLIVDVSCTQVKICHELKKTRWSCEGSYFVPKLPPDTTAVTFTDLRIKHLNNNTFQNLTGLRSLGHLIIKTTLLKTSTTDVFNYLKYLREFAIIKVRTPLRELRNIFFGLPVNTQKIVLSRVKLGYSKNDIFDGIKRTNVSIMSLEQCGMERFDGSYFTGMNRLDKLVLSDDRITTVTSWGYLPSLTYIDFFYNEISTLPKFKNDSGFIFYPKLEKLFIGLSNYDFLDGSFFIGLDQLHTLGIYIGSIGLFRADIFQEMKYLRAISLLSRNHNILRFEQNVFNLKLLDSVELRNLHVQINEGKTSSLFNSCTQLTNLVLKNVSNINFNDLLKPLTKLEHLLFADGQLNEIPDTICNMNNLTRLSITYTTVSEWHKVNCPAMTSLRNLSLKHNQIRYVNEKLFSHLLFDNEKLIIDLSSNPFACNCKTLWFRDWERENAGRFRKYKHYRCFSPDALGHVHLINFSLSWDYCNNRHQTSPAALAGVILAVMAVIFVITAILSYTNRWSIRFCIYQALVRKRKYKALVKNGQYRYDAFVCYCKSDVNWVLNKVLPIIEEENHFNLCLHDRDFVAGNDIVDNIVDSMQQSRKVVLVLSSDFAQSSWCQFEASIAQQKILEDHYDIIIPVLLNEIPSNLQTKRLGVLLKQKTYLEWPNEDQYEEMFWERFIRRLNENEIDNEI